MFMLFLFPQNSKILPGSMIYFDTVSNLMHDIWEWLAPSPTRTLYTRSNESRVQHKECRDKGNYPRKEVKLGSFECSLSRFGAILWNQNSPDRRDISEPILKKKIRVFLLETLSDRDDYVEVDTLKFLNLSISPHHLALWLVTASSIKYI